MLPGQEKNINTSNHNTISIITISTRTSLENNWAYVVGQGVEMIDLALIDLIYLMTIKTLLIDWLIDELANKFQCAVQPLIYWLMPATSFLDF